MKQYLQKILDGIRYAFKWYASQYKGKWYQRVITPIATVIVTFFLYLGAVDINFLGLFGLSPSMECIQNPISNEASYIYSCDNDSVPIGKFFSENRTPVRFENISPYVIDALISTEDERFYQHHGIDYQGLFAAFKDMAHGNARGASTITQQLVKNLFKVRSQYSTGLLGNIPGLKILIMKSKEWVTAIKIENLYSKRDILTLYLNTVDFGSNAFGIRTAAKTYFKTEPQNLTADQAAILVGLLKATTTYNPKVNPKNSLARRNVVLNNMYTHGKLTKQECDSLCQLPIELKYNVENNYDGRATYFREAVREELRDWCKENDIDLYGDGLKIYTTLDSKMQAYAEWAVNKQMKKVQTSFRDHWRGMAPWRDERGQEIKGFIERIAKQTSEYKYLDKKFDGDKDSIDFYLNQPHKCKLFAYGQGEKNGFVEKEWSTIDSIKYMVSFMHCGFVVMEPQTSHVKAWVGDIDFDSWKYDKVTSTRQPGSTFKLFVYASAFEHNDTIDPDYKLTNVNVNIKVPDPNHPGRTKYWHPHNADGGYSGAWMPLKRAFALSVNTVAAKLGLVTGINNVAALAKNMGITTKLEETPSLSLGACEVKLIDLVDAYSCVMNDGMQRRPILVTKVLDRNGKVIYDCEKDVPAARKVMKYRTAYFMQQLLYGGVNYGGTSTSMRSYVRHSDIEMGGKTGTSNNHSDAWFVGCTPNLVGGAWVGGEYRSIHFRTGALGQGGKTALPVFGYFLDKVLADDEPRFRKYHAKFPEAKEEIVKIQQTYEYVPCHDSDSVDVDELLENRTVDVDELLEETESVEDEF